MQCIIFHDVIPLYLYRPQRSYSKVMFLHLSVILFTGEVCMAHMPPRHACPLQAHMAPGACMPLPGHACPLGTHAARDACPSPPGHAHPQACTPPGHAHHPGMHTPRHAHPPGHACLPWACTPPGGHYEKRSMSGRYTSYWNAFLLQRH